MTLDAPGSRVSMMLRLVGIVVFALGASLTYLTYEGAVQSNIVPQIVPVFYLGAVMLMIVGFIAIVVKYKN